MDKNPRVIITFTSMPNQYEKVSKTLDSLLNQSYKADAIYFSLPEVARRTGEKYPPVPEEIRRKCQVISVTDYGPITKISGGLLMEDDSETIIITCDNDMVYPSEMVEKLVKKAKLYPNSAVGSAGMLLGYDAGCPLCAITPNENNYLYNISKFHIPPEGRRVDSVYGYSMVGYRRNFFPKKEKLEEEFYKYALMTPEMLLNDDIVISGYLSLHNIERRIFPDLPNVDFVKENGERKRTEVEISINLDKFFQRMNSAIRTAKSVGMYATTEQVSADETILGVSAIILIVIVIIIFIAVFLYYYFY